MSEKASKESQYNSSPPPPPPPVRLGGGRGCDTKHGQSVALTILATPHIAQVILDLVLGLITHELCTQRHSSWHFHYGRDSQVMISTRGHRYTLPLLGVVSFVGYPITFEYLKLYLTITQRATSKTQHGLRLKDIINIHDILEHLKSKNTCSIAMMRQSTTYK